MLSLLLWIDPYNAPQPSGYAQYPHSSGPTYNNPTQSSSAPGGALGFALNAVERVAGPGTGKKLESVAQCE
jgi:hypothetical protein